MVEDFLQMLFHSEYGYSQFWIPPSPSLDYFFNLLCFLWSKAATELCKNFALTILNLPQSDTNIL